MSYKQWQTSQGFFQVFPKNLHALSSNNFFVLFILVLKKRIYTLAKSSVLVHSNTTQCWAAEEQCREQWNAAAPNFHQWLPLLCICTFQSYCSSPFKYPLHPCQGRQGMRKSSKSREGGQKVTYTRKEKAAVGSYSLMKPHKLSAVGRWWEDTTSLTKTLKLSWHTGPSLRTGRAVSLSHWRPFSLLNCIIPCSISQVLSPSRGTSKISHSGHG